MKKSVVKLQKRDSSAIISANFIADVQNIIDASRNRAYAAVNVAMLERNWQLGKRIAEEEIKGKARAEYGVKIIAELSKRLTDIYGKGFTKTNLYSFLQFYKTFPEIFHTPCGKSILDAKDFFGDSFAQEPILHNQRRVHRFVRPLPRRKYYLFRILKYVV